MKQQFFYQVDTGPKWCFRVAVTSLLISLGIFLMLPLSEILYRHNKNYTLRTVNTLDIVKPPPRMPPKVKKERQTKPKLAEPRRQLSPLHVQAALQLEPGFGDYSLNFGLQAGIEGESLVFEVSEVDEPPRPVSQIAPLYPLKAKLKGIEGRVVLEWIVLEDGSPGEVKVVSAQPGDIFVQAALAAVKKWRFKPGTRNGKPVPTRVIKPFVFSLAK